MNATALTRWLGATLGLVLVVWIDGRFGHLAALVLLMILLVAVAIWGGHGRAPR
jgi:hypothetical protein